MPHPLARDKDRAADVEAERVVLERRSVAVAHQEPDQSLVRLVQLLLLAGERDPGAVGDGEVARHHPVEPHEPVIQNANRVVGCHFDRGGQRDRECSGEGGRSRCSPLGCGVTLAQVTAYIGTSGFSYPSWKPGFYPAGTRQGDFLRLYSQQLNSVELNTTGYQAA